MSAKPRRAALLALLALALAAASAPAAQASFGLNEAELAFSEAGGEPVTEAGSHPFAMRTSIAFNLGEDPGKGIAVVEGALRNLDVVLPPGFVGKPSAVPPCEKTDFVAGQCPDSAALGVITVDIGSGQGEFGSEPVPLYNLVPSPGAVAQLGFVLGEAATALDVLLNPEPPHNVITRLRNASQLSEVAASEAIVWGNPSDPAHDPDRGRCAYESAAGESCPASLPDTAFLTLPRSCSGPLLTTFSALSWWSGNPLAPDPVPAAATSLAAGAAMEDCGALGFASEVSAAPTTNVAASPSGFDFGIEIDDPGLTDPDGRAGSDLKKAVVTLPEGITVNPAAAGGLAACSQAQLAREDYDSASEGGCPNASKVATVEVETPLLEEILTGSIFLAEPYSNPLGTLLAGYLVIRQPERGIIIKIAGKIEADHRTGRLTASFDQNPQLPFSDLEVSFFGGARGPLITPQICGDYGVRAELHPWSGNPPDVSTQPFEITQAPAGGPCATSPAALPHAPGFDAGTVSALAGRHSPFVVNLRRPDGSQRFSTVRLTPPPGLTAKLAGTPACSEAALAAAAGNSGKAEQASPSCPAASQVGSVFAAAGAGPAPYWAPGTAYLAGPYKGAPLSVAIVTPAVAGPFDLGTVVIRTALHVNPATAQITAVSDPIPELLQGIPLDVRVASIRLDKPQFTLNGTSCDPFAVTGQLLSTLGALAPLHSRFQLAECGRLGFKPKLALRLKGGTKRGKHPKLIANLRTRPGDANIGRTQVTLPRSAFLDQSHIRTICTRVQWAADACPKGSVYGRARATSPLLDYPLAGNVYLRSSDNQLPDLIVDLRGPAHQPIRIELVGRTDSVRGALRNTFDLVPDAPASTFRLELFGGKRGLVVNSRNICARNYRALVRMNGQNGRRATARPVLRNSRCKKRGRAKRGKRAAHRRAKQGKGKQGSKHRASLRAAWRTG